MVLWCMSVIGEAHASSIGASGFSSYSTGSLIVATHPRWVSPLALSNAFGVAAAGTLTNACVFVLRCLPKQPT